MRKVQLIIALVLVCSGCVTAVATPTLEPTAAMWAPTTATLEPQEPVTADAETSSPEPPPGFLQYDDDRQGLSLVYPDEWIIASTIEGGTIVGPAESVYKMEMGNTWLMVSDTAAIIHCAHSETTRPDRSLLQAGRV